MGTPDWDRPIKLSVGGNKVDGWDCDLEVLVWTPFRGESTRKRGPYHGSTAQQAITEAFTALEGEGL